MPDTETQDHPECDCCGPHFPHDLVDFGDHKELFCFDCRQADPDAMSTVVWVDGPVPPTN